MRDNVKHLAPQTGVQASVYSRPTDFVKLPSKGRFYPSDHPFNGEEEVEVGFMTTKEEDILVSPSLNEKGIVFDRLLESLLVKQVKAQTLLLGDKNAILINARKNAYGSNYDIVVTCPKCFKEAEKTIDLDEVEPKELASTGIEFTEQGTFVLELPRTKVVVELKLLTSTDEEEIVKKAEQKAKHNLPETLATDRLRQMIVSVNGDANMMSVNELISKMPIADSRFLKKKYLEAVPDVDFTYTHECEVCEHVSEGGVPLLGTFFWPDE